MAPEEIPKRTGIPKLHEVFANKKRLANECICGCYGFYSKACPHIAVQLDMKCGGTLSEKTDRAVFCMKRNVPKYYPREYIIREPCTACKKAMPVSREVSYVKLTRWTLSC
jgi:hypothetical protein